MGKYKRTLPQLTTKAILHWPDDLLLAAGDASILPLLLKTQDAFISVLKLADKHPLSWKVLLEQNASLSGPLFLKHLMVLSDLGGEALNKLPPLSKYVPGGALKFLWAEKPYEYKFIVIQNKCNLSNTALRVDSKKLLAGGTLTEKMNDVAMFLLYGALLTDDTLPAEVKDRCIAGSLIGNGEAIEKFVKENYIRVSRQVGGATSNELGQQVQNYVLTRLVQILPTGWETKRDATLPGVAHKKGGDKTNFDIVARSPSGKYFGIEVSFQVTTNSVIERKSREAEALMKSVHKAGHKIAYVIDGAGNINIRKNAISNLCTYSDCTVAMSEGEIDYLAKFLIEQAGIR